MSIGVGKMSVDLFKDILPNLDKNNMDYYYRLSVEDQKKVSLFIAMKFMSGVSDKKLQDYYIIMVNGLVNKDFWELSKYPELQWKLLSMCGSGKTQRHYFPGKQKEQTELFKIVSDWFPHFKNDEIEDFIKLNGETGLAEQAKKFGYQDKELNVFSKAMKDYFNGS